MATLPIFWATVRGSLHCLGAHDKRVKRYPENPATLGEHLRKRRLDLLQTQVQVARRFGITPTAYVKWEADQITPSVAKWPELLRFLDYDPLPPPVTFAESVTSLRRALGLDKRKLAGRLGVDVKSVLNWEAEKTIPVRPTAQKLLALGLNWKF